MLPAARPPAAALVDASLIASVAADGGARGPDRIEQWKRQQPGEKSADMRLPGDLLLAAVERERAHTEQDIESEPHRQERQHPRIAQHSAQRQSWYAVGLRVVAPDRAERPGALKHETHRRRHEARDRSRCADHRRVGVGGGRQMRGGARGGGYGEQRKKAQAAEAACDRGTESEQPHAVEPEMGPVTVDQRVTEEGPDSRAQPRDCSGVRRHRRIVAGRDEREPEQELYILLLRKHPIAYGMHKNEHRECRNDRRGHVEDRLTAQTRAAWLLVHPRSIGCAANGGKQRCARRKREGLRPPSTALAAG